MNDPLSLALLALVGLGGMAFLFDNDSDDTTDETPPPEPVTRPIRLTLSIQSIPYLSPISGR